MKEKILNTMNYKNKFVDLKKFRKEYLEKKRISALISGRGVQNSLMVY